MTFPDKYEFKRFISRTDRSAIVASHLGPSRSAASTKSLRSISTSPSSSSRSQTLPATKLSLPPATSAPAAPTRTPTMPPSAPSSTMNRSASQPIPPSQLLQPPAGNVWSDLASLQGPTRTSTLPLQYLSSTTTPSEPVPTHLSTNFPASGTSLGTNFASASYSTGLAPQGPSSVSSVSPGAGFFEQGAVMPSVQSPFTLGASGVNPFTQMAAQAQAQAQVQQNPFPSASPFGTSLPQQSPFAPQAQQPTFSQSVTNPFFNAAAQPQNTLSPQPQAPFIQATPSPVPFTGSPFQQPAPTQSPFQQQPLFQQPTQMPFQPQPPQFGSMQPSGGPVAGNPFTSWLTQPPNGLAGAHVGQGSVNGRWGSM
jgi:stromal membrane-associated protein